MSVEFLDEMRRLYAQTDIDVDRLWSIRNYSDRLMNAFEHLRDFRHDLWEYIREQEQQLIRELPRTKTRRKR